MKTLTLPIGVWLTIVQALGRDAEGSHVSNRVTAQRALGAIEAEMDRTDG